MEELSDIELIEFNDYKHRISNIVDILGKSYIDKPTLYFSENGCQEYQDIFQYLYDGRNDYGIVKRKSYNTLIYRDIRISIGQTGMMYEVKLVGNTEHIKSVALMLGTHIIQREIVDKNTVYLFSGLFSRELPLLKTAYLEDWYIIVAVNDSTVRKTLDNMPVLQIYYSNDIITINDKIMKTIALKNTYVIDVKTSTRLTMPVPFRCFGIILWTTDTNEQCIRYVSLKHGNSNILDKISGDCLSKQVPLAMNINNDLRKYYICFNEKMVGSTGTMESCNDRYVEFAGEIVLELELYTYFKVNTVFVQIIEPWQLVQSDGLTQLKN